MDLQAKLDAQAAADQAAGGVAGAGKVVAAAAAAGAVGAVGGAEAAAQRAGAGGSSKLEGGVTSYIGYAVDDYNVHEMAFPLPDGSLEPATEYTFRVHIYDGDANSPVSRSSRAVVTPALSAPSRMNTAPVEESETAANPDTGETSVTLLAPAPIDDGGIKIDGYIIDVRHVGNGMPDTWTTLGSHAADAGPGGWQRFRVDHLIPHTGYQFRISAYNQVSQFNVLHNNGIY